MKNNSITSGAKALILLSTLLLALSACALDETVTSQPDATLEYITEYIAAEAPYYYALEADYYADYDISPYNNEPYYEEYTIYYYETADYGYAVYYYDYDLDVADVYSLFTQVVITGVIDGDTVEKETGERIRFIGVNAPEIGEPGADEATAFVRERTLNQTVWLEADGNDTDRFGRLRRYVWLQYPNDPTDPVQIQNYQLNALLLSYGLAEVLIIGNVRNAALFREIAQPLAYTASPIPDSAEYAFIGNRNSEIFHSPNCRSLPAYHNRIHFETRNCALDAGHRPCRICNP